MVASLALLDDDGEQVVLDREEAATLLSNREKFAVLGHRTGLERLCQLGMACHAAAQ